MVFQIQLPNLINNAQYMSDALNVSRQLKALLGIPWQIAQVMKMNL